MVVLGQKWLLSGKGCCILIKKIIFGQRGSIRAKWLYSGKSCYNRKKYGWFRANVVVIRQSCCIRTIVVIFGQKWLYSGKMVVFGQ